MRHSRSIVAERVSTTAVFFINGMALALFFSNIPLFKEKLLLNDAELGTALSFQGVGTVVAVVAGGLLASKLGTRLTMLAGALMLAVATQALIRVDSFVSFATAVVALGAVNCFIDVSMNTHASLVEREWRSEIMPSFHASYNFGGFAGASLAGLLIGAHGDVAPSMSIAGIAMVAVIVLGWKLMGNLRSEPDETDEELSVKSLMGAFRNPTLLILAGFVILALFTENAMNGWSSVYLKEEVHASAAVSANAFASFQLALAIGRLIGSPMIRRIGPRRTIMAGGILASAGILLVVSVGGYIAVLIGFAAVGLGLANCIPMFFTRAAAAMPGTPSLGIATVNTIGYLGYVGGPLVLGLVASQAGLKPAIMLIMVAMLAIAVSCRVVETIRSSAQIAADRQRS